VGALLQNYGSSYPLHVVNGWEWCFQHKQTQRLMSRLCVSSLEQTEWYHFT